MASSAPQNVKKFIGRRLLSVCETLPVAKPAMRKWGLRTSKEWFGDRVVRVQMPDGNSFKLASLSRNYLSFELFWRGTGYYEPVTTLLVRELVQPGDTFIDAGANIGFYSLVLSASRPRVRIIAFEPNPKNFAMLSENARVNGFTQITCEPLAMSDTEGTATLYLSASDMSASLQSNFEGNLESSVKVRTATLDGYLERNATQGRLIVKVDVEGHEESFFSGAQRTLASRKPDIITEVALNYSGESIAMLRRAGYRFYPITDQGFQASDALVPVVRGRLVFLNYLLSAQPLERVAGAFERIAPRVKRIDLTQTSKCLDWDAVQKFKARSGAGPPAPEMSAVPASDSR